MTKARPEGRAYCLIVNRLPFDFLDNPVEADVVAKDPENVADVHADAFVVVGRVGDIGGEGFLVAVEGEADDFAAPIQDRGAGVSAGDVIVREEVDRSVITVQGRHEIGRKGEIVLCRVILLAETAGCGIPGNVNRVRAA